MPEMKGVTVKIPADLHAEVKAYIEAHNMTMGEFITLAVDNDPKIQITQEDKNMERMRTLAFQVPDSLFQRVKAYLERNHMSQKQFVIGLIEAELEQDEAQYQASRPEEQEDEEESDDQSKTKQRKNSRTSLPPRRPRKAPTPNWRNNPPPTRTPPPWTILRPVPRKFPRRMAGPRKPGKKTRRMRKCSRTAKKPRISMG